jgi:hypothetical protein
MGLAPLLAQEDPDRVIPDGGIFVAGWTGRIDRSSALQLRSINDARLVQEGGKLHATTGPAVTYWNPANTIAGDYTVKATFLEPRFMELNSHPHSYGLFIGGTAMGTDRMRLMYCVTYGDGSALVRGFGPDVFTLFGPSPHEAVHRAADIGEPVSQEIAWKVGNGRAECLVNGIVVASYDRAQIVGPGRLQSTDGVYGLRLTHNVEAVITGFTATKE